MPTGVPIKEKQCVICGKLFVPEKPSTKICPADHHANCPVCGKDMIWNTRAKVEPCSKECRKEATRQKNLEKYGVDHPMKCKQVQQTHRQAMLDKYGVESPLQCSEIKQRAIETNREKFGTDWALGNKSIRERIEDTNLDRYGSSSPLANTDIQNKSKATLIDRYGVENAGRSLQIRKRAEATNLERYGATNPMKCSGISNKVAQYRRQHSEEIRANIKQAFTDKYGVDNPMKVPELVDGIAQTLIQRYGVKYALDVPELREKYLQAMLGRYRVQRNEISRLKREVANRLNSLEVDTEFEYSVGNRAYDIHVVGTNILIEINPTYTHSFIGNHWGKGLEQDYHLDKTKVANENGYRCIHIFDWDDVDKIVDMLKPKKSIYARDCELFKLDVKVANEFLDKYHLQGKCKGQLLCLGLYHDKELVQVLTFGKPRYDKKHYVELLRLCTHSDYRVVGGASKLFKFATDYYSLSSIISYCDLSKFSGNVYQQIGMKLIRTTPPQEVWTDGQHKITANLLRQQGYDRLFDTNYGKGTSNEWLMLESGWLPVYDCGQSVYEY